VAASAEPESEAVAELGVPLVVALSACDGEVEVAEESGLDVVDEDEDGALWVVWAVGSVAGAVCWARADPA
jgi:hypothetical protein